MSRYISYAEKLRNPRWQKKRLKIFERDNWSCRLCADTESTLCVHHLCYRKCDPWDYEDAELETLCEECHDMIGEAAAIARKVSPDRLFSSLECYHVMAIAAKNTPEEDDSSWWKQRALAWQIFGELGKK